jgi:polyhydroxybutyrate depolymerase
VSRRGLAALVAVLALAAVVPASLPAGTGPDIGLAAAATVPVWGVAGRLPVATTTRTATVRLASGGRLRTAIVLTPAAARPVPLVVVLHGRDTTPTQELVRTGLADLAANGQAVLAYPAGVGRSWNAGTGCCATAAKLHVDDVAFLRRLIGAVEAHAPVDPARVYLIGYSNGGRLALTAACALPGAFAGVATYGTAQPARCPANLPPLPVFIGYGSLDPHAAPGHVPDGGTTGPVTAAGWRSVDGCTGSPAITSAGPATVREWTSCRGGGRVALVRWDELTHRWPGAGVVPADATGRALMWRFLTGQQV